MSCESEQEAVDVARRTLAEQQAICDGIAGRTMNPNDPEVLLCRADERRAREALAEAERALTACRERAEETRHLLIIGAVTFLRVHEIGAGFGGGDSNFIDADVIFKLDTSPLKTFGFQLRNDENFPVRDGMLSLLREAVRDSSLSVITDYFELVNPPNQNSIAFKVALLRRQRAGPFPDPRIDMGTSGPIVQPPGS
jgi:hypothetical protein